MLMGFFKTERPETLLEEHVQKLWDLSSRIKQLEDRFEGQLDELSKRYRRAEQSEARLERKRVSGDCDDGGDVRDPHPAITALKRRQGNGLKQTRLNPFTG